MFKRAAPPAAVAAAKRGKSLRFITTLFCSSSPITRLVMRAKVDKGTREVSRSMGFGFRLIYNTDIHTLHHNAENKAAFYNDRAAANDLLMHVGFSDVVFGGRSNGDDLLITVETILEK
ncbi:uncharacterized protein Triagg1_5119 [Trichoderma aggressivum f. europaeum]|uniref:Uncharacterized protein n=1 Tax=Trichoderma aggressivum f. europaeum TaxID=173218 RepID=A0AAE1M0P8_9HYPO|nr:hypothetical protein Triagg1_5119 [Trichoderma aggressivum f. europaeum]